MEKTHRLDFLNTEMRKGQNVTVRRGTKWAMNCAIGDHFDIYATGSDTPTDHGVLEGIAILPFLNIPQDFLALEHDSSCHDLVGLSRAMKMAYGDKFTTDDICTILIFRC